MSGLIESEIRNIVQQAIMGHPTVMMLQSEIARLQERINEMEKCCVCVKMKSPPNKEAPFNL